MEFVPTQFEGAWQIRPAVHQDNRGFFLESYSEGQFARHGINSVFVQDNHSRSAAAGVLRGLHFQAPPAAQAKLVRVTRGAVCDVIVDIRAGSPTYGKWQQFELTAGNFLMLYVPAGFAHGFCTLEPDTEVQYKVDRPYSPRHENGIIWNDPDLCIGWPVQTPVLSDKDANLARFSGFVSPFDAPGRVGGNREQTSP